MQCSLKPIFTFMYRAEFDNGLIEHEFDHVFFGESDQNPKINPEEVETYRYIAMENLQQEVKEFPENFTPWFIIALDRVLAFNSTQS